MKNIEKAVEISVIREFLKFKGCKVVKLSENEKPDAIAIVKENIEKTIGIEHTDYHVDTEHGKPSLGRGIHQFWLNVQGSIDTLVINQAANFISNR